MAMEQVLFIETGSGIDLHGQDVTRGAIGPNIPLPIDPAQTTTAQEYMIAYSVSPLSPTSSPCS